jgi:hypothetical protein
MALSCARCGKSGRAERFSHSRQSGHHYCLDVGACERRIRRLAKKGATFERGFLVTEAKAA